MREFDLYPPMQQWLEAYLKDKYKTADEIIVVDAHSERLDRVLRKHDIVQEEAIGVDIQIDVLGIVKKSGKFTDAELKNSGFTDAENIAAWAKQYVDFAYTIGSAAPR